MADTNISVGGVVITDITGHRAQLVAVQARLVGIFAGFDPANPEPLLPREAEIVDLANNAERLRELVDRWDEVEAKRTNVLSVWELVKAFTGDA